MGRGKARRAKPRNCLVCHRPTIQVWLGMDQNCYKSRCTAGRPERDNWVPTRRAWLDRQVLRGSERAASAEDHTPA